MRWVSRREGVPDPFLDLDAPPKPRQESDWLTAEEFHRMLSAAGRLQPKVLAAIIKRATERAGIEKKVTAHTLRHTAASWLRQARGDARLVAEYLGHADLTTVSRYAHVASDELHEAAAELADQA